MIGYGIAAALMVVASRAAMLLGVDAEGKSLEQIAEMGSERRSPGAARSKPR